jgi:hypothetical protein
MSAIVLPDYLLLILLGIAFAAGYIVNNLSKKRSIRARSNFQKPFRFSRHKWMNWGVIGVLWIVFILLVLPIFESSLPSLFQSIGIIFMIISIGFGFFFAYLTVMWIEKQLPRNEFGLWLHRIVATILFLGGAFFAFTFAFSAEMTYALSMTHTGSPLYSFGSLAALVVAFFIGIAFFAGYMEFLFERKAGILIFAGNQRF